MRSCGRATLRARRVCAKDLLGSPVFGFFDLRALIRTYCNYPTERVRDPQARQGAFPPAPSLSTVPSFPWLARRQPQGPGAVRGADQEGAGLMLGPGTFLVFLLPSSVSGPAREQQARSTMLALDTKQGTYTVLRWNEQEAARRGAS